MNKQAADFYEIYEYEYVSFWQTTEGKIFVVVAASVLFALLAYSLYYLIKKRRLFLKAVTPWQEALNELEKLRGQSLDSKHEAKQFYFSLTVLIKKYLEKRFAWVLKDKTDDEMIIFLREKSFPPRLLEHLEELFKSTVVIKFADAQVIREYIEKDLALAHTVITQTIPDEKRV